MGRFISIIIIAILIAGGFLLFKDRSVAPTDLETGAGSTNSEEPVNDSAANENVKEFSVDAAPFSFAPSSMTVNKGDTVKITVRNVNGVHDLKIDEFGASTRLLNAGESETITFVADKAGTFEYYCSVGNHRALGMVGTLSVN